VTGGLRIPYLSPTPTMCLYTVAYLVLGELGDGPPFGFFEQLGGLHPPLGGDFLGEDYGLGPDLGAQS